MIARTLIAALLLTLSVTATPADAQRRQRVVEVFGDDPDPKPSGDEIIIIYRKPESDRYRIPTELREPSAADRESQIDRVQDMVAIGRTGIGSCSAVGPGGSIGCQHQTNRAWRDQKDKDARARRDAVSR